MKYQRPKSGFALVLALIVMVILFTLGSAYLGTIFSESQIAKNLSSSNKAFYLAEAGIQRGIRYFNENPNLNQLPWSSTEYLGEGNYSVSVEYDSVLTKLVINSTGQAGKATRLLRKNLDLSSWTYTVFSNTNINAGTAYGEIRGMDATHPAKVHANATANMGSIVVYGTITQGAQGDPFVTMPIVDMAYYESIATLTYIGDTEFKANINSQIIYVKKSQTTPGKARINTYPKKQGGGGSMNFQGSTLIAEGGIEIVGTERFDMTCKSGYPALITKTGSIIESGSGSTMTNRNIQGAVYSEQGTVHFESIKLEGCMLGNLIELLNNIYIQYSARFVSSQPPGMFGGVSEDIWEERNY